MSDEVIKGMIALTIALHFEVDDPGNVLRIVDRKYESNFAGSVLRECSALDILTIAAESMVEMGKGL